MTPAQRALITRRAHVALGIVVLVVAWLPVADAEAFRWFARAALLVVAASAVAIPGALRRVRGRRS